MKVGWIGSVVVAVACLGGCKNDDAGAQSASDSASGTDGDTDDSDSGDIPTTCEQDSDCNDGNDCRIGSCGDDNVCTFAPVVSSACRPQIDVEYPPRAATIRDTQPTVTVTGRVTSGAGRIETLTINGQSVDVDNDGGFRHDVEAHVGGNSLILETTDLTGATRRRVQSFLWSRNFAKPDQFPAGISEQGLGIYLDQEALDDEDPSAPIDDLASLLNVALQGLDLASFFDPNEPVASSSGYDIYLTDLTVGSTGVRLLAIDGGAAIQASLRDIHGDLYFDCTNLTCELAGGDGTGGLTIDTLTVRGNLVFAVTPQHRRQVMLTNVEATIDDLDIYSDNWWTDFLISIIRPFIIDGIVSDLEDELENQIETSLGPLLAEALSDLSFSTSLDLPNLSDPETPITVDLVTDFAFTDFHDGESPPQPSPPQGGAIVLRGGAYAATPIHPYDNLGVPLRDNCGAGGMILSLKREGALEIGLTDDLLNQILYSAWDGGLLQFPFTGIEDNLIVSDVVVDVSGMLAPTASDCGVDGRFLTHVGDLRIDASLNLGNTPVDFVAFSTLVVTLDVTAGSDGIGIGFAGVESVNTELTVEQDEAIDVEPTLIDVLEEALVSTLVERLGGEALGGIGLPTIDLSAQLGLPPGSAEIAIEVLDVERIDGTTLITGRFGPPMQ
jgi:hypothetical protein